ncbi:M48 family peptidase [Lysobacter sp. TY2-98]|uniref:M48 family metalloprotease n=1 Tax=Lysobacter sp. TY2-98 TaxID=2290922 RepID=UPI000E20C555|nr:M48 family metalloprotease [Lysobacter sp. TY2-98]AXK72349.1 M48 family peptidase [Lysobacter sp. TY2-98]
MRRISLLTAALVVALGALPVAAQESRLPDIGSSAGELITPAQESAYGAMTLAQLRHYDYVLEDPLIDSWLDTLGHRLAGASDDAKRSYTFFMLREREINAFATLGGYVGVNSGLVLAADREDEVAGVLAHEISHITQQHVLRAVEKQKQDQLPTLLAMLGAIVIAQQAHGNSADDAAQAAMVTAMGLAQQRAINYTRASESEADRVGMQVLARSHFDPRGMADFFSKLQARMRTNEATADGESYDYLRSHPMTLTRITEAKERAERLRAQPTYSGSFATDNPLLPGGMRVDASAGTGPTGLFDYARERLRVMSAPTPVEAVHEYDGLRHSRALNDAEQYGLAVAYLQAGQAKSALPLLTAVTGKRPGDIWPQLALAEAEAATGNGADADVRFEAMVKKAPTSPGVVLTYAKVLGERGSAAAGKRAQAILRPLMATLSDDPVFQRTFARASELAGDPVRAGEAHAEAAYLSGRPELALAQLNNLKKRDDLDYYARSRIDARIAAITPTVLELKRQGVRDDDLKR